MDQKIKKICGLLESPDNIRRCGAAAVLAELAPKDPAVVKALGQALAGANQTLTSYLLEALEAIGAREAAPHVLPLLNSEDLALTARAAAILSRSGAGIIPHIEQRMQSAGRREKVVLVDILARMHTKDAFRVLLDHLFDPDFELVKEICGAVRRHMVDAGPAARLALHKQAAEFSGRPKVQGQERVLASDLLLMGSIGRAEARTVLLKYASPKSSPYIRVRALDALKHLEYSAATAAGVASKILDYLKDPDSDIVRQALGVMESLPGPTFPAATWPKLLKSPAPAVRAFAARKLASMETAGATTRLLELLNHEDNDVSEIAARALSGRTKATQALLDALAAETDIDSAWRLAKILKPHSVSVDAKTTKTLASMAQGRLEKGDARYEPLLYFLRNISPSVAEDAVREAGLKCMRAGNWATAAECLRRLIHTDRFDDETAYILSICNLKQSPRELAPNLRAEDHSLRGFQALLRNRDFKLFERMKKDKTLDAADLYYIGFHFSESAGHESDFGRELLEHVAKKSAASKPGKAARSKLKLIRPASAPVPARKAAAKK